MATLHTRTFDALSPLEIYRILQLRAAVFVVEQACNRRTGLGRELTLAALAWLETHAPGPVRIGAQSYLERFYRGFGFVPGGEPYDEDGIPHMPMLRPRRG
jgi:predicted GNAT family N-acyltransferase